MIDTQSEDVIDLIHTAMHLFRSRQVRALRESSLALTQMEARVLGFFERHPGETLTALITYSGRDKGQLARLVRGLRDRQWLEARPDENDRRNQRLYLTQEGREIAESLRIQKRDLARLAVQGFSKAEEQMLASLLGRLSGNLG